MENVIIENKIEKKEKLWSLNFFLLWQGQLVSAFGDVVYEIALGFWILAVTGSTGLMGTLMAASTLPRVLISPFAGVVVDRSDRKKIIVWMDIIRGVFITFVGVAALLGFIQVWMVFAAGVIMGICAAFFNPSIGSVVPDIVPSSKLMQANSYFGMIRSGTNLVGNPIGGVLFQVLGAPIMFLFNGISYILSAFTEVFIRVPKSEKQGQQYHFWTDLKEGMAFIWNFRGLRNLIFIAGILNFFFNIAIVLFIPLFQMDERLGAGKYGIAMGLLTGGMFAGMVLTSVYNIKPRFRFTIFIITGIISCLGFAFFPYANSFILMLILLFVSGVLNAVLNVMFEACVQLTVPQDKRGKVFSLMGTVLQGLSPIAMAVGGLLGEIISIKLIIFTCCATAGVFFIPFIFMPTFIRFINYDPDKQQLNEIM
ncbi:MAG: MFS transporter [Bacillota bacterium]